MGIDTEVAGVFMRRGGNVIRHLQKHRDIDMEYHYVETQSGREFDVRDLPERFLAGQREEVMRGDRAAHKAAIGRAIDGGHALGAREV